MKLLENNTVELTDTKWLELREQVVDAACRDIVALQWGGAFDRTVHVKFKTDSAAMMFLLRWS